MSRSFLVRVFHLMQGTAVHHAVVPVVIAANVVNGGGVGEGISGRAVSGVTHIAQLERNLIARPQFRQIHDGRQIAQLKGGPGILSVPDGKVHKPRRGRHKGAVARVERLLTSLALQFGLGRFVNSARHLPDVGGSTIEQEVTCFDDQGRDLDYRRKAGESMLTFWRQVWARKAQLTAQRQAILQPLLDKLDSHPVQRTLYAKCLKDLNKCIQHQWIVLYSATDNQIHSLKFYLTHFACVDLKKRSLVLKTSSDNNINALCTRNLTVFNIETYLDLEDASKFYAPHWTPPPVILHRIRDLKHQPKTAEGKTVKAAVRERAQWMSQVALNFWQNFVANAVASFGVDLHGCNFFKINFGLFETSRIWVASTAINRFNLIFEYVS